MTEGCVYSGYEKTLKFYELHSIHYSYKMGIHDQLTLGYGSHWSFNESVWILKVMTDCQKTNLVTKSAVLGFLLTGSPQPQCLRKKPMTCSMSAMLGISGINVGLLLYVWKFPYNGGLVTSTTQVTYSPEWGSHLCHRCSGWRQSPQMWNLLL